jgi:hypothetical protein
LLTSNAVRRAELDDAAVGADELADNAVSRAKVANNAAGSDEIVDGSIRGVDVQDHGLSIKDLSGEYVEVVIPSSNFPADRCFKSRVHSPDLVPGELVLYASTGTINADLSNPSGVAIVQPNHLFYMTLCGTGGDYTRTVDSYVVRIWSLGQP